MREIFLSIVAFFAVGSLSAQSATEWLARLDSSLGERYAMNINVAVGTEAETTTQLTGFVMVEGDGYYITLGTMEVYSDGKLRYEVNNERKEVVEDSVNLEAVDLLTNPTRAFDFVPEEFDATVTASSLDSVTLQLTPHSDAMGISTITLTMARRGDYLAPTAIVYDYEGDIVTIGLTPVDTTDIALRRWSRNDYRAYDIVSFL